LIKRNEIPIEIVSFKFNKSGTVERDYIAEFFSEYYLLKFFEKLSEIVLNEKVIITLNAEE
ncbi:MAG: hypothetical protein P4L45_17760, partial [Ignavibacteriaceae bacterium]|nr:hypothetical protein [Ignavibacteriaceae bacterium]